MYLLIAGGTRRNGGTKVVQTRIDTTGNSVPSAEAGGGFYVSKPAPGFTFFDDIFNVIIYFLYLVLQSHISFDYLLSLSRSSISHLFYPSA
jgi:hypothetical protein